MVGVDPHRLAHSYFREEPFVEDNVIVGPARIGAVPQDLSYRDEDTLCTIGDRNTIREFVTINRGTVKGGGVTRIGSGNLLMTGSHVAHDCEIESMRHSSFCAEPRGEPSS